MTVWIGRSGFRLPPGTGGTLKLSAPRSLTPVPHHPLRGATEESRQGREEHCPANRRGPLARSDGSGTRLQVPDTRGVLGATAAFAEGHLGELEAFEAFAVAVSARPRPWLRP